MTGHLLVRFLLLSYTLSPELSSYFADEDAEGSDDYESTSYSESSEEDELDAEERAGPNSPDEDADARVEAAIEGDFDRLIQNIREAGDGSSAGVLSRMWDVNLEEREAEFRDDLRAASGVGKIKKKVCTLAISRCAVASSQGQRGRRRGIVLSPEVRALIGEGNQAYVDVNIPETIRIMQEVIRIEPRAASAWSVLAQCYDDMNEKRKALQLRIMAAHLNHDADEWAELAQHSRSLGYNQQALYCYGKIYHLDPTNVTALWDRAFLAKEIGDLKIVRAFIYSRVWQKAA